MLFSKRFRFGPSKTGFTFLEIIITLSIAAVIAGLTLFAFTASARGAKSARTVSEIDFELLKVYSKIRRQIISAYEPANLKKTFITEKSEDERSDSMCFFTESPEVGKGTVEAFYYIKTDDGDDKKKSLCYCEYPFVRDIEKVTGGFDGRKNRGHVISEKITGMKISSIQNDEIINDELSSLPDTLLITLYYMRENKEESLEFTVKPGVKIAK